LSEHETFIAPYIKAYRPEGVAPPFPVVIQFPGCSGLRAPFMEQWVAVANAAGYMAVTVDSHRPRGIDRERALASVCAGKELLGQERAGDVLAAVNIVSARDDVDTDKIVLAGWSHGAWSVMDLLAMDFDRRRPAGLPDAKPMPDIAGTILFYPYCGPGSWTRLSGWARQPKTIAFIAGADSIVDGPQCRTVLEKLNHSGAGIDVRFYPDADHIFDDPSLEAPYDYFYNAPAATDAEKRVSDFLAEIIQ